MRRNRRLVVVLALVIFAVVFLHSHVSTDPLAARHFKDNFNTFILTKECKRSFDHITSIVPGGTVLTDNKQQCMTGGGTQGWQYHELGVDNEWGYTKKYQRALQMCAASKKSKCLILEDDIVFINSPQSTFKRIKMHTMFGGAKSAWDCSKIGLGWLPTGQTGNKSICRIVDKRSAACLASYMLKYPLPADLALKLAQIHCKVKQHRFLLTQHTGFKSLLSGQRDLTPLWQSSEQ